MLNSLKQRMQVLFCCRGAALIEYVVLLAFVIVLALFFSGEWDEDYNAFLENKFKANNISTGIRRVIYNTYIFLTDVKNLIPKQ